MSVTHLECPSCGGALAVAEGERIVSCRYCRGQGLVEIPEAVPRSVAALGVTREEARAAAQGVLTTPWLPSAFRAGARIADMTLCYVPFYEVSGIRLGSFRLQEQEKPPLRQAGEEAEDFQRWVLERPPAREETRILEQTYARISPACELPELGIGRIRLEELRQRAAPLALEPYDLVSLQGRGIVIAPTRPPARFAEEAERRLQVEGDRTRLVESRLRILYYPVWQARLQYRGRPYEIAVDGVTGSVLQARLPADRRRAAAAGVAALGAVAFAFGRLARHLFQGGLAAGQGAGWIFGAAAGLLAFLAGAGAALLLARVLGAAARNAGEVWLTEEGGGGQGRP